MASGYPMGRDRRGRQHGALQSCRECQRPMRWAANQNGKRIPLDLEPTADGDNVLITQGAWALTVQLRDPELLEELRALNRAHEAGEDVNPALRRLYSCHWDTCPNRPALTRKDLA
jgi:hypothetical protein